MIKTCGSYYTSTTSSLSDPFPTLDRVGMHMLNRSTFTCPSMNQLILSWFPLSVKSDGCRPFLYHVSVAIYSYHMERLSIESIKWVSSLKPVKMHLSYNIHHPLPLLPAPGRPSTRNWKARTTCGRRPSFNSWLFLLLLDKCLVILLFSSLTLTPRGHRHLLVR